MYGPEKKETDNYRFARYALLNFCHNGIKSVLNDQKIAKKVYIIVQCVQYVSKLDKKLPNWQESAANGMPNEKKIQMARFLLHVALGR